MKKLIILLLITVFAITGCSYTDSEQDNSDLSGYGEYMEEMYIPDLETTAEKETYPVETTPDGYPVEPYVGMDASLIDKTGLGMYTKTGHNTQKYANDPKRHDCTLYYWMEDGRCIFLARVQDDIGKVILVEESPAGSYFGNPID